MKNFFRLSQADILKEIETIVTQKSNPSVHRTVFSSITKKDGEPIKDFTVCLKSAALYCEFACLSCSFDLLPMNAKDQFIRGLTNDVLQTDILAKANQLKSLEDIVKHAEAFEAAVRDQTKLQDSADIMAARTSDYQQSKTKQTRPNDIIKQQKPCVGCGSLSHGSGSQSTKCPAWGKRCQNCNTANHFSRVCRKKTEESVGALIAHVKFNKQKQQFTTASDKSITEIPVQLTPYTSCNKYSNPSATLQIFPNSGASI